MPTEPSQPDALTDVVRLDLDRRARRGIAEAIFCEGKNADQLRSIAAQILAADEAVLFTRVRDEQLPLLRELLPDGAWHEHARIFTQPAQPPAVSGGAVVVVSAGSSDLPVAMEAVVTLQHLGREVSLITDVGVAGIHRVLGQVDALRAAAAVIVVAGMDGALPSVVAGLVESPVVAVPTSVGYGAAFEGLAALLAMLNACAPGVAVVNIDNGYGAGHLAAQITRTR